ncbi:hypothetical protein [Arthrobacter sp. Soil763]|uniref:hypothetical protein n=1 Tax=Arthrobacter sp. Soil763 TaxID=1736402 RepID=UPI0006F77131|nr:hypothetical protein [Arthrobacter sp. Soil763]KRE81916.1 hypothetical protein ASG71_02360 [Arthrobacter sp. Soil763]
MSLDNAPGSSRTGASSQQHAGGRLRQVLLVPARWTRRRVAVAILTAFGTAGFLLAATGLAAEGTDGVGWAVVAAASALAGALAGSYVGAPIGAAATLCDLRWPILGLFGVIWAVSPREAPPLTQAAVDLLALAVMGWTLSARLESERKATLAGTAPDDAEACTDCRPLFPARPRRQD